MFCFIVSLFTYSDEQEKFELLYRQYCNLMHYSAFQVLRDNGLAEDAVSEAFIRIYRNLHKIDSPIPSNRTAAFVVTITRNVALTIIKKEKKKETVPLEERYADDTVLEDSVVSRMTQRQILDSVNRLSEELRQVFLLYYAYDMTHAEISSALNISANTAAVRLHRARKKLAKIVSEMEI